MDFQNQCIMKMLIKKLFRVQLHKLIRIDFCFGKSKVESRRLVENDVFVVIWLKILTLQSKAKGEVNCK